MTGTVDREAKVRDGELVKVQKEAAWRDHFTSKLPPLMVAPEHECRTFLSQTDPSKNRPIRRT